MVLWFLFRLLFKIIVVVFLVNVPKDRTQDTIKLNIACILTNALLNPRQRKDNQIKSKVYNKRTGLTHAILKARTSDKINCAHITFFYNLDGKKTNKRKNSINLTKLKSFT